MIKQVIVVEGKSDIARVSMAVDADMIATEGFTLRPEVIERIRLAYEKRGIIILTDPDGPGERIRKRLIKLFPKALNASTKDDVGIEDASPESIRKALYKLRISSLEDSRLFSEEDLFKGGLIGKADSSAKREAVGAVLGIGYGNAKQFLKRLNHYGVTREEWENALQVCQKESSC